jgi:hypothetical protein
MQSWIRRHHRLAVWVMAAVLTSSGKLQKFLHTGQTISGGGRKFG